MCIPLLLHYFSLFFVQSREIGVTDAHSEGVRPLLTGTKHPKSLPASSSNLWAEERKRGERERNRAAPPGDVWFLSLKESSFFILTFVTFIFQNDSDCWPFIWLRQCHLNHKINEFDIWVPGFSMMDDYILFYLTCHVILKYSTCLDNESRWRYSSRSLKLEENQTIHRVSRGSRQSNIYWESRIC